MTKEERGKRTSGNPTDIDGTNWYYEHGKSIEVIHKVYIDGHYLRTDHIRIPHRLLRHTVRRHWKKNKGGH